MCQTVEDVLSLYRPYHGWFGVERLMVMQPWSHFHIADAFFISGKSKDPSTKVGAVITSYEADIVARGWNDHPRGIKDLPERRERPLKYVFTEHAERNAIYNAARLGVSTKGTVIHTTRVPCPDCARAIIQAGITQVRACVAEDEEAFAERSNTFESLAMFEERGVGITLYAPEVHKHYEKRRYEAYKYDASV